MKFGHHGANHPVKDLDTGQVVITSQNHGFAVDPATLPPTLRATHVSLFDGSLQGLARTDRPAFCFQGHPEASPGPHDVGYLFDRFAAADGQEAADAEAHRHQEHPDHRRRADRHRPGLRVRLLRRAGVQGAARGGLPGHPGQLQPGDDHDRPGDGRRHLHRADHLADGRARSSRRSAPTRCCRRWAGRPALNCALDLARARRAREVRRRDDRRHRARRSTRPRTARSSRRRWRGSGSRARAPSLAHSMEEALQVQASVGFPVVIRPSFTLGGTGGGIAYNREEFVAICERGLDASPTHELLIEESVIGWKEFEMEVVRDRADNCIIVCSIENLDPMGVHTGDSITVAPAQTLTDKEYQMHARRLDRGAARDRRGHRRLERAVRDQPGGRAHGRHRDEPARVALLGARLQGDRLPDRQDRGQARGRLHARRAAATTSPAARRRPPSSRPSTTSSPRCRASPSRSSRRRTTASPRR